jgi:hypothetical protein
MISASVPKSIPKRSHSCVYVKIIVTSAAGSQLLDPLASSLRISFLDFTTLTVLAEELSM